MHELARAEHDLPALEVLAGEAAVLPGLRRPRPRRSRTPAAILARALLHDDGVGALRHHAAGEDAHALRRRRRSPPTACPRTIRRRARASSRDPARGRRSAPRSRPSPSCRGPGTSSGETTSAASTRSSACADVHALGRGDRREERADQRARAVDRHRVRIVVVGAGGFAQGLGLRSWVDRLAEFARRF